MDAPSSKSARSRRPRRLGGVLVAAAAVATACSGATTPAAAPGTTTTGAAASTAALPADAQAVVNSPTYAHGSWSWDIVDADSGSSVYAQHENQVSLLGSTTKLFTVGTALDAFGADSTISTPVYADGQRAGGSLQGNLVLVGSGDFILGGRGVLNGDLEWYFPDQFYAYATPTAKVPKADPLAGLDELAKQVKASGITSINGDVLIDDRLFDTYESKEGVVTPIMVNDNLITMQMTPGATTGAPTTMSVQPQTAYFTVDNQSTTSAAGGPSDVTATLGADNHIVITGQVPVGAPTSTLATFAPDPAAYARALFIEALRRAGVTVDASLISATGTLPTATYPDNAKVASLTSPKLQVLTKLVTETSDNRGAETLMCLLAAKAGSKKCTDGLQTEFATMAKAGLDRTTVYVYDGEGTDPASATPTALVQWLTWASKQPWGKQFALDLPDANGDGKILAKTGTSAQADNPPMPSLYPVAGDAGYMETASGKHYTVAMYAQNGSFPTVVDGLTQDLGDVQKALTSIQKTN